MAAPRDSTQRLADTRDMLEREIDAWVATAGDDGPWLVPLSFGWDGSTLVFATLASSRTVRNLEREARVQVSLGDTRNVVLVHGSAECGDIAELTDQDAERFGGDGEDPRRWATTLIRVRPASIQAWREVNEHDDRWIMRDGAWMA